MWNSLMTPVRKSVSGARMTGVNKLMRVRFHEELHASYDFDLDAKFPMMTLVLCRLWLCSCLKGSHVFTEIKHF